MADQMNRYIDQATTKYRLHSPDGKFYADFQGGEIGMGGPTKGNVSVWNAGGAKRFFTSPAWAPASFSDDSKYFVFLKASDQNSGYSTRSVVEIASGLEVWCMEPGAALTEEATPSAKLNKRKYLTMPPTPQKKMFKQR